MIVLPWLVASICTFGEPLESILAQTNKPWSLSHQFGIPKWWDFHVEHRTRYESLDGQFRAGRRGSDQLLVMRTSIETRLKLDPINLVAELVDSRQAFADSGTPLNTGIVNTIEPLQAYLEWAPDKKLLGTGEMRIKFGRMTKDLGSRRLLARNRFRNTRNAFTGLDLETQFGRDFAFNAFYLLPISRRPSAPADLLNNDSKLDREGFNTQLWGAFIRKNNLALKATGEAFLIGLHEYDTSKYPTRNRQLLNPGWRFFQKPNPGKIDYQIESVIQFGTSRASTAVNDQNDLDHLAHFQHAEVGYTWRIHGEPRAALLYDYASGDHSSTDGRNQRFDTLYGARRFDFGPTGIYGAFARSNIQSPGYRFTVNPYSALRLMATHRFIWLASSTDAWTTSGLRDTAGLSGNYLGHQMEMQLRWDIVPRNIRLELGGAYHMAGSFIHNAPNAADKGNTTYGYLQCTLNF